MQSEEEKLKKYLARITPPDETARQAARDRWASLAHPLGGLGLLEDDLCDIAALTGSAEIDLKPAAALVFCADNGVVAEGISQTDASVTGIVADNIVHNRTSVCRMAASAGVRVAAVDMGIYDFRAPAEGDTDTLPAGDVTGGRAENVFGGRTVAGASTNPLFSYRIANGTANIRKGPAMTREQAAASVNAGIELAGLFSGKADPDRGRDIGQQIEGQENPPADVSAYKLLAAGEMGIGNTTTAAAILSVLLGLPAEGVTGRGAGLSDEALKKKIQVVADAVIINAPNPADPLDVLAKVGGFDIGGMCGLYLGGAIFGVPVLIDGIISSTAALLAYAFKESSAKAMIASHVSSEPLAAQILDRIGKKPLINAGMHLGEATGAVAAMPLLFMAEAVYRDSYTFDEGNIAAYEKYE